jgi:hypothetical protein
MSKSTTRQKVECMQGWLATLKRKPITKVRHVRESKISLDEILREQNK